MRQSRSTVADKITKCWPLNSPWLPLLTSRPTHPFRQNLRSKCRHHPLQRHTSHLHQNPVLCRSTSRFLRAFLGHCSGKEALGRKSVRSRPRASLPTHLYGPSPPPRNPLISQFQVQPAVERHQRKNSLRWEGLSLSHCVWHKVRLSR